MVRSIEEYTSGILDIEVRVADDGTYNDSSNSFDRGKWTFKLYDRDILCK